MKKIPTLFKRGSDGLVIPEFTVGLEDFAARNLTATVKYDGTAMRYDGTRWWFRYDAKRGRTPPAEFEPAQEPDEATGHWPGWAPVHAGWAFYKPFMEASGHLSSRPFRPGTYELCGPKINGNPQRLGGHWLFPHGDTSLPLPVWERSPGNMHATLAVVLRMLGHEGIVFWDDEGPVCKIKRRDFGLSWPDEPWLAGATP